MKKILLPLALITSLAQAQSFVEIRAVGDMMIGNAPTREIPKQNYFANVLGELNQADITFGNAEGTFCDDEVKSHKCTPGKMCFAFRSPTHLISQYKEAGFDILNIANNHIFDYGHKCATSTRNTIEGAGIEALGLKQSQTSSDTDVVNIYNYKGKDIVFIGLHFSDAWGRVISISQKERVKNLINQYNKKYDFIIVSMHAGAEGVNFTHVPTTAELQHGENRGNTQEFAKMVIDMGADLVIGHGPHVLRGLDLYKNRLIIYSLGNFATYTLFKMDYPMNIGAIMSVSLAEDGQFISGKVISTKQFKSAKGEMTLTLDPKANALNEIKKLSQEDFNAPIEFSADGQFTGIQK